MPDPVQVISSLEMAGADSIVYTPAGRVPALAERDLAVLHHCIHSHFNLRLEPDESMVATALKAQASMVTMIGRLNGKTVSVDLKNKEDQLAPMIHTLRQKGIIVNALIDTDADQLKAAVRLHLDYIELNAVRYVQSDNLNTMEQELENLRTLAMTAARFNVSVMLGGELDYPQLRGITMIKEIEEVNVGQPLFNRSLYVGLHQAVKDFIEALRD